MGQVMRGAKVDYRDGAGLAPVRHDADAKHASVRHDADARHASAGQETDAGHAPAQHPTGTRHASVKALWERRHSFRVQVPARASVFHKGKLCGYFAVHDVSIGGCLLHGSLALPVSELVDVLLHLPHRAPLALSARVLRSELLIPSSTAHPQERRERTASSTFEMGLRFEHTTPKAEDCLQDFVVETFANAKVDDDQIAVVVEPRHAERQALVRTLRELGRRAIGVATALDAVQLLGREGEHVDAVFIEAESSSLPSLELVEFIAHNHPHIARVLVGEPQEIAASWVAQATGEVHALLETPCDQEAVHRVLHRLQFTPHDSALS